MKTPRVKVYGFGRRTREGQTRGQAGSAAALSASAVADVRKELDSDRSDRLCVWPADGLPPSAQTCEDLLDDGADFAHAGLGTDAARAFPDLAAVVHDWSMVNAPREIRSTSWRLSLEWCLLNRTAYDRIGGLDPAFRSLRGAGLELGFRALKAGAIVEHFPELAPAEARELPPPPRDELYVLVLRHLGQQWSRYLLLRRILRGQHPLRELRAHREAVERCRLNPAPAWEPLLTAGGASDAHSKPTVSVIIPTLGRYRYLALGLDSLRRSSVPPAEIIVVDQNSGAEREERFYDGFADLPLRVLWQEEIGQSVARNAGLAAARGPLVFLFDDDSLAAPDLIQRHLEGLGDGRYQVSTGVSFPPPPTTEDLPPLFRFPRLAQTLDTGNCLVPLELARRVGGLDRHFDRGPGADMDFGTRLYMAGSRILHNPAAQRIHYKAPAGGLRVHGASKYNTDTALLAPFPPVTQAYYGLRYLPSQQARERAFLQFLTSKLPRGARPGRGSWLRQALSVAKVLAVLPLLPLKYGRARRAAQRLLRDGPRLGWPTPTTGASVSETARSAAAGPPHSTGSANTRSGSRPQPPLSTR